MSFSLSNTLFNNFMENDYPSFQNTIVSDYSRSMFEDNEFLKDIDNKSSGYSFSSSSSYVRDNNGKVKKVYVKKYTDNNGEDKYFEEKSIGDDNNKCFTMTTTINNKNNSNTTIFKGVKDLESFNKLWDNEDYTNIKKLRNSELQNLEKYELELNNQQKELNKKRYELNEKRKRLSY